MKTIHKQAHKKLIITAVITAAVLVVATSIFVWAAGNNNGEKRDEKGTSLERTQEDKALERELEESPGKKPDSTHSDAPSTPQVDQQTGRSKVNVILTNTGMNGENVNASGFVSNIVESDGSCEYVFARGETVVRKPSVALTNPTSTTCKSISFAKSELGNGVWVVYLEYGSGTSFGSSNQLELEIK